MKNLSKSQEEKIQQLRAKRRSFTNEFKTFISRGNVIDLAVGVIIGSAFTSIVNSLVKDIIMPVISLIAGGVDFTKLSITIPNFFGTSDSATIAYGNFLQNVVDFLIIAFVIFLVVRLINNIHDRAEALKKSKTKEEAKKAAAKEDEQIVLLREIRDSLKK
ncbi:large-conductance mechanosensitive channel protein MscL [Candidatus Saccharibacteria bacterium]|nr:large-conductance mechanosensitive channel protein MscL [Candidatus Saccharibacteria bacterium]